jgi:hypothetical protein
MAGAAKRFSIAYRCIMFRAIGRDKNYMAHTLVWALWIIMGHVLDERVP